MKILDGNGDLNKLGVTLAVIAMVVVFWVVGELMI